MNRRAFLGSVALAAVCVLAFGGRTVSGQASRQTATLTNVFNDLSGSGAGAIADVTAEQPTAANVLRLYMSPNGHDTRGGMSQTDAVRTLARIQARLVALAPTTDVEVHISPGLYVDQSVRWTFTNGRVITFMPLNGSTERPVFDGGGGDIWFTLAVANGTRTNLSFRYLKVQNYNTAMVFKGNRNSFGAFNAGNHLYGMYFYRIGGRYSRDGSSTAAVAFENSRDNLVANSHFINVENFTADAGQLHALYLAHYANGNLIERNRFAYVSGDPVRTRDASNYNRVFANVFIRTGTKAHYSDWYCEASRSDCTKLTRECPSQGNQLRDNEMYRGYFSILGIPRLLPAAKLFFSSTACGPLSAPRLQESGNVLH